MTFRFALLAVASAGLGCHATLDVAAPPGTGATDGGDSGGGTSHLAGSAGVAISEIMYHPVAENAAEDNHEFVEIHNTTGASIALHGWKLQIDGADRYTFPADARIEGKQYLVVAKNRKALAAVQKYGLDETSLYGDYTGQLDNGGAAVTLADGAGKIVDRVTYLAKAPWPIGADAFGAGEPWFPEGDERVPFARHQYLGRSLMRYSFAVDGSSPRNWEASPVDLATPGKANTVSGEPPAIVELLSARPQGATGLIGKEHKVEITAVFSEGQISEAGIEYFLDPPYLPDEPRPRTIVAMIAASAATPRGFTAVLPAQPGNSIVRYRVVAKRGGPAPEVVSPRATDPFAWHAYFVNPPAQSPARAYHLFIAPASWTTMWTNTFIGTVQGPNDGCNVNPNWDARVPAVLAADGTVYDVRVRYQGSRSQRREGPEIANWPYPGPTLPSPFMALSWKISFPSYAGFNAQRVLDLNKIYQACPGSLHVVESNLLAQVKIPAQRFSFARVYVNTGYYHYMMEVEGVSEEMMKAFEGKGNPVGDLYKSDGTGSGKEEGPWSAGDWTPLKPNCDFTALQRYKTTYRRLSHQWKDFDPSGHTEIANLIEELGPAVLAGTSKAYLEKYFDVDQLITLYAVRNWAGVWDDGVHNFYPYKRPTDGKWIVLPQDFDLDFGGDPTAFWWKFWSRGPTVSLYSGEAGIDGGSIGGTYNKLKNAVIKAFRVKFNARLMALSKDVLSEGNVIQNVDDAVKQFSMDDWLASPAKPVCDVPAYLARARKWIKDRAAFVAAGIK